MLGEERKVQLDTLVQELLPSLEDRLEGQGWEEERGWFFYLFFLDSHFLYQKTIVLMSRPVF